MVIGYPKSGTTWTQEMVWLIANDLDYKAAEIDQIKRFPILELSAIYDWETMDRTFNVTSPDWLKNSVEYLKQHDNPRFIKTHLPFSLLPDEMQNGNKSPKIIYITRNPKDVCVSYMHHGKLLQQWRANMENFAKVFLADKAQYGSYWKHIKGYWNHRNSLNALFIKYEDMKQDLPSVIRIVSKFLNKSLTEEEIQGLAEHLSFDSMKKNKAVNADEGIELRKKNNLAYEDGSFIRSGTVGKYKEELSPEIIKEFDTWIKKNIDGTDLVFHCNFVE